MISKSLKDTEKFAKEILVKIHPHSGHATVVALSGDLGSGKTTFTKAFAGALGISPENITSPTFVIEKRFDIGNHHHFKKFIHIDAYRLEKSKDIEKLGWKGTLSDSGNIIIIEWPENIGGALPHDAIRIYFRFVDEYSREIEVK